MAKSCYEYAIWVIGKYPKSYINSEVIRKWRPLIVISQKLEVRGIEKDIISKVIHEAWEEIESWILQWIEREINQYKKKGVDWFDIIQKLMRKWYRLWDIKKVIKSREE